MYRLLFTLVSIVSVASAAVEAPKLQQKPTTNSPKRPCNPKNSACPAD